MSDDRTIESQPTVGPYRLIQLLASGGAGQIHVAVRDNEGKSARRYAIKTVLPSKQAVESVETSLRYEAQLGTQLLHPNIVAVHDYGRHSEVFYLVMDYIDGSDLAGILERAREAHTLVPDIVSAWIISEVCEGLAFAHSLRDHSGNPLKLVHRDISPQNILVGKTGEVRIADFGVAHFVEEDRPETEAGVIKGKLRYMTPEYLLNSTQDHRGDIFSAGLVLFEMLTNNPAYPKGESIEVTLERISTGAVEDVLQFRPELREELLRILSNALSPDPERRYNNADDMAADLKRFVWSASPGLTRARVGEILGNLGFLGSDWVSPRVYEDSMHAATDAIPGPVFSSEPALESTSRISSKDVPALTDQNTIPVVLEEVTPVDLPDDTARVPAPPDMFDSD